MEIFGPKRNKLLKNVIVFYIDQLKNGIKTIHKKNSSDLVHCALIMNIGSRDEEDDELGSAHFLEHMFFKGTKKRKSYHILSYLDNVGGDINAYTTKEEIVVHASCRKKYFNRAFELICDIVFNSCFPENELEKEKNVIIDEINYMEDSPSELIFDEIEEMVFNKKRLGNNILGSTQSVKSTTRNTLTNFLNKNLDTSEIVFSSIGNINQKQIDFLCDKYLRDIPLCERKNKRKKSVISKPFFVEKEKKTNQSHIVIATPCCSSKSKKIIETNLINTYLAGNSMSSILNLKLREKHGIAYNIESFFTPYSDNGIFGIYVGTDASKISKAIDIIDREIKKLTSTEISDFKLSKIKKQFIGQILFSQENNLNYMLFFAKSYLNFSKFDPKDDYLNKINAITSKRILEVADSFLKKDSFTTLIYK